MKRSMPCPVRLSALDAASRVAGSQRGSFGVGDEVEILLDAVLQARGCDGIVDRLLRRIVLQERIDQRAAEGIAAADAVDNVHMVGGREEGFASGIEHGGPVVVACGAGAAQRDGDRAAAKARAQLRVSTP